MIPHLVEGGAVFILNNLVAINPWRGRDYRSPSDVASCPRKGVFSMQMPQFWFHNKGISVKI